MDPLPSSTTETTTAVKKINGQKLSRRAKKGLSPTFLALLALDLTTGAVEMSSFTGTQAKAVTGASASYLTTAKKLTPEQLEDVKRGRVSLSTFHNNKTVSDARIDRFIAKAGADRVLSAIDKLTAPFRVAAE
jgi:hypothetical protein